MEWKLVSITTGMDDECYLDYLPILDPVGTTEEWMEGIGINEEAIGIGTTLIWNEQCVQPIPNKLNGRWTLKWKLVSITTGMEVQ